MLQTQSQRYRYFIIKLEQCYAVRTFIYIFSRRRSLSRASFDQLRSCDQTVVRLDAPEHLSAQIVFCQVKRQSAFRRTGNYAERGNFIWYNTGLKIEFLGTIEISTKLFTLANYMCSRLDDRWTIRNVFYRKTRFYEFQTNFWLLKWCSISIR